MNSAFVSFVMDGVIAVLLIAVIFFTAKLSLNLRDFRAGRREMDKLVKNLSDNIERAERAIAGMREAARESGRDLQGMINKASALSEELELMSEAGNNIARRMAQSVERGARKPSPSTVAKTEPSFLIRDAEFETSADGGDEDFDLPEEETSGLQSRAEKELFEALRGAQGKKKARV
ncbi:MAG TPA: DUF6468 domain-containing protein [Micavibrio sp.]|jgi:hypothetical protein